MSNSSNYTQAATAYAKACADGKFPDSPEAKQAFVESYSIGANAEKARISGILDAPEADCRSKQAHHLAMTPGMSVADARKHLATMPADIRVEANAPQGDRESGAAAFGALHGSISRQATASPALAADADPGDDRQRGAEAFKRARGH